MKTLAPIFRQINTSGGIFRYDSCSSFLFSGGCFTCAINPTPDRFAATRWAYARITFRRIFFNIREKVFQGFTFQCNEARGVSESGNKESLDFIAQPCLSAIALPKGGTF